MIPEHGDVLRQADTRRSVNTTQIAETPIRPFRDERIDDAIVSCAEALLGNYCTEVTYSGHAADLPSIFPRDIFAAVLGYVGGDIKGAITIASTEPFLVESLKHAWLASSDRKGEEEQLQDWSRELANQLLGRIKTKLAAHGVGFQVATPVSMSATALQVPPMDHSTADWHHFITQQGQLWVRLDVQAKEGWVLPPIASDAGDPLAEGELLLF